MIPLEFQATAWRKSRRSQSQSQCVEIAAVPERRAVRDSKNPHGPALVVTTSELGALLAAIKTGRHDLAG
jgi:Domain of unknown function (DUF397)